MEITLNPIQQNLLQQPLETPIFLEGPAGAGKTSAAVARLLQLLGEGLPGGQLLALTPQRTLATPYEEALRTASISGSPPTLLTVGGLARRSIDLFWPLLAEDAGFAHPDQPPVFLTLETAQYYMAHVVRPLLETRQPLFESVNLERNRLFSQILDNLNKAAVVGFPHSEIGARLTRAWVGTTTHASPSTREPQQGQLHIYADVQTCASLFRQFCLEHNLLDFSLQMELFRDQLWSTPPCRLYLMGMYRHLIFDNLEEDTPLAHDLLRTWLPQFESALLVYDWQAGYRRFLGADPQSARTLADLCPTHVVFPETIIQTAPVRDLEEGLNLALQIASEPHFLFDEIPPMAPETPKATPGLVAPQTPTGLEARKAPMGLEARKAPMGLEARKAPMGLEVASLVKHEDVPPGEIVVLAPFLSDALRFSLIQRLEGFGIAARSHRPSRSLREEPAVQCLLTLSALAHPEWGLRPTKFDVAVAFVQAIEDLDLVRAQLLAEIVYRNPPLNRPELPILTSFDAIRPEIQQRITYRLGERFEKLRQWLETRPEQPGEFDYFLSRLFGELLSQPGFGFHASYDRGQVAANLIESVRKFRRVAGEALSATGQPTGKEYLQMVEEGVIAAQYLGSWQLQPQDAVLLAPAYTFLMANRPVQVQFWLDPASRAWVDRLYQPLTQPYVLSRGWPEEGVWGEQDEYQTGREALRRLILGLLRRCRQSVYIGLTELNEQGYEQRGPLLNAFQRLLRHAQSAAEGGQP